MLKLGQTFPNFITDDPDGSNKLVAVYYSLDTTDIYSFDATNIYSFYGGSSTDDKTIKNEIVCIGATCGDLSHFQHIVPTRDISHDATDNHGYTKEGDGAYGVLYSRLGFMMNAVRPKKALLGFIKYLKMVKELHKASGVALISHDDDFSHSFTLCANIFRYDGKDQEISKAAASVITCFINTKTIAKQFKEEDILDIEVPLSLDGLIKKFLLGTEPGIRHDSIQDADCLQTVAKVMIALAHEDEEEFFKHDDNIVEFEELSEEVEFQLGEEQIEDWENHVSCTAEVCRSHGGISCTNYED